jgi:hypothetical protein
MVAAARDCMVFFSCISYQVKMVALPLAEMATHFRGSINYRRDEAKTGWFPLPQIDDLSGLELQVTSDGGAGGAGVMFVVVGPRTPVPVPDGVSFINRRTDQPVQRINNIFLITYMESYDMRFQGAPVLFMDSQAQHSIRTPAVPGEVAA